MKILNETKLTGNVIPMGITSLGYLLFHEIQKFSLYDPAYISNFPRDNSALVFLPNERAAFPSPQYLSAAFAFDLQSV
jgi:hypothetical protein